MNILVTGVSRGVGLEICNVLLNNGYNVYGIARSYSDSIKELEDRYSTNRFIFNSIDLADINSLQNLLFKQLLNSKIPIHGFVNNAAMAYDDIITNLSIDKLEQMYNINVFAPMIIVKHVLRNMILHKIKGSIVHISSISAHTGYKGLAMYASSKGAIECFSKNTAREWGQLGVRSNVVVPGFMETAMSSSLSDEQKNRIYQRTSLKKPTNISSVAETVAFLLSENSISITGQNIFVDSGTI